MMEILKRPPTMKLPEQWFTGDAWADVIYRGERLEHVTDAEYAGPRVSTRGLP
ncbi:hypothetical protein GCM10010191_11430 [Actinomadura vinacea]|uniref:Uncharacterized protein n=1 Tax=Actinomadura vinacea TaxID=115336 RepID=A0ABP5VM39_9ACTN